MPSKTTSKASSQVGGNALDKGKGKVSVASVAAAAPPSSNGLTHALTSVSPTASSATTPLQVRLLGLQKTVVALTAQLRDLSRECSALQKEYAKEKRGWERVQEKLNKKKASANKGVAHQSGIAKPGYISNELCTFIGVSSETKMARTEVIKYINQYIKDNQLQDAQNKKVIVPDTKLRKLLRSDPKKDEVTYFNLQKFMRPHYADPAKAVASA